MATEPGDHLPKGPRWWNRFAKKAANLALHEAEDSQRRAKESQTSGEKSQSVGDGIPRGEEGVQSRVSSSEALILSKEPFFTLDEIRRMSIERYAVERQAILDHYNAQIQQEIIDSLSFGPQPLARRPLAGSSIPPRPWTEIEADLTPEDLKIASLICIWCGHICDDAEHLERHEEECAP